MGIGISLLVVDLVILAPRRRSLVYDAYGPGEVVETRRRARL